MFDSSIPDKSFFQICIIVDDLERYAENYLTILGFDVPSDVQITRAYDHTQATYYGKPMNARAKITSFLMGQVAFELLACNAVHVIMSDQRMPEMSGTEFLARAKDLYPRTLRIMLSASAEAQSLREAINRGAVYKYLDKPWDSELLRATIKEAFQRARV